MTYYPSACQCLLSLRDGAVDEIEMKLAARDDAAGFLSVNLHINGE